jgi:hypothetical protein
MVKKVCEAMQRWRMFHNSKELEKEAIDFLEESARMRHCGTTKETK